MTLQELKQQVSELPTEDLWALLKLLIELLQPEILKKPNSPKSDHYLGWSPGFFERTAGAWQGEPLERGDQGECDQRDWSLL
ncbi:MAG: hypothetical protein KGQ93_13895 [Cyanobacteria bacterium REEB459]|nr:hypothetical protein [Cyanobacteria bacterium REEB459]